MNSKALRKADEATPCFELSAFKSSISSLKMDFYFFIICATG